MTSIDAWSGFVEALRPKWEANSVTDKLRALLDDDDLCIAIWGCLGRQSADWMSSNVPILDNTRPIDLINSEEGRERIRWILISNPWW